MAQLFNRLYGFMALWLYGFMAYLSAGDITTPPTQFPSYPQEVYNVTSNCFISKTNQVLFSWTDGSQLNPWYAIYDVTKKTFTTLPTPIAKESYLKGVWDNVYSCYNPDKNQVIFSWEDNISSSSAPWYAIYDVAQKTFTTPPTQIAAGAYTLQVLDDVYCCYNSNKKTVIFSWISDDDPHFNPYYALLDEEGKISAPTQLSQDNANDNLYGCSLSGDQVMFSYNLSDQTKGRGVILNLSTLGISPFSLPTNENGIANNVYCCYDHNNHQVAFSWASISNVSQFQPYYILYDLSSSSFVNSAPSLISDQTFTSQGLDLSIDVYSCYNSIDQQLVFTWGETSPEYVYYALFDTQTKQFSLPASPLSLTYTNSFNGFSPYCCYNSLTNQVFFSWTSNNVSGSGYNPWFAIYTSPLPPAYLYKALHRFSPLKMQK